MLSEKTSRTFSAAKAIALFSIVTAHTSFSIDSQIGSALIARFGSMGVIVFLISSGFFFHPQKNRSITDFLSKKMQSLFIPWFFCGSLVYFEAKLIMGQQITLLGYAEFLLGKYSYLYYMTVLTILYILFYHPVKRYRNTPLIAAMMITAVSQLLTAFGVIDAANIGLTNYLNICNWVGYFSIGILMQKMDIDNILKRLKAVLPITSVLWMLIFNISLHFDNATGYFSKFAIPLQLLSAAVILGLSSYKLLHKRIIFIFARYSFFIYLTHLAIIPIVYKFIGGIPLLNLLVPAITVFGMTLIVWMAEIILHRIENTKLTAFFYELLGIRVEKG